MYEIINEKVKMLAAFDNGKIIPKVFCWQNRDYKIKNINLVYQERHGQSVDYFFSVETETGAIFKLKYNSEQLVWWVGEVWID